MRNGSDSESWKTSRFVATDERHCEGLGEPILVLPIRGVILSLAKIDCSTVVVPGGSEDELSRCSVVQKVMVGIFAENQRRSFRDRVGRRRRRRIGNGTEISERVVGRNVAVVISVETHTCVSAD